MSVAAANHRIISEFAANDPELAELIRTFAQSLGPRVLAMEAGLVAQDFKALHDQAHRLSGAGGEYGYPVLTEKAADLELSADCSSLEACAQAIAEIKSVVETIVPPPSSA